MPLRFLVHLPGLPELKLITASSVALLAAGADALTNAPVASWESLTLKGALVLAVIYLLRENSLQRAAHKAEAEAREKEMLEAIKANTAAKEGMAAAMIELRNATKEQTDYYKAVAKVIVNRAVQPNLPDESAR